MSLDSGVQLEWFIRIFMYLDDWSFKTKKTVKEKMTSQCNLKSEDKEGTQARQILANYSWSED